MFLRQRVLSTAFQFCTKKTFSAVSVCPLKTTILTKNVNLSSSIQNRRFYSVESGDPSSGGDSSSSSSDSSSIDSSSTSNDSISSSSSTSSGGIFSSFFSSSTSSKTEDLMADLSRAKEAESIVDSDIGKLQHIIKHATPEQLVNALLYLDRFAIFGKCFASPVAPSVL